MYLKEIGCECGRVMELAQVHVECQALVFLVLNLQDLLPET